MKISRQVGTVSEALNIYIQNATVSTGAGLANVVASNVLFSWARSDQAAISSGTAVSSGTLGTYAVSSFLQFSSTSSLGWYQFDVPDGIFVSGRSAFLHIYGAPNMAPVPIEIELTKTNNQVYVSAQVFSSTNTFLGQTNPVGVSSGTWLAGVSTVSDKAGYGVSSLSVPVGVSSFSALAGVSTITTPVGVSSGTWLAGVSTVSDKSGYGVSSLSVSVNASTVSDKSGYGVSSFSALVGVSTMTVPVGVSSGTWLAGVSTVGAAAAATIADKLLGRNVSSGGDGGRTVSEAMYVLRNKVDTSAGLVYATDDTTSSWAFTVSTVAGNPVVMVDPA